MTIKFDELKTQDDLDKAVAAAVKANEDPLKKKNTELLDEVKDLKRKFKPFDGLDADEIKATLAEAKELRESKMKKEGDIEKLLEEQRKQHQTELDKRDAREKALLEAADKALKDRVIREAMDAAKIAAPFIDTVIPFLASQIVLVGEGDKRKALIGEKTPTEYLAEFVAGDKGKHYVTAEANSGGGAGGSGVTGYKGPNPFDPKTQNITEQMKLVKENPKLADQLRAKVAAR